MRTTKRELEDKVASLERQLAALRNELGPYQSRFDSYYEFIPCGKIQEVYGHPWEEDIRNLVSEQYDGEPGDGETAWVRLSGCNRCAEPCLPHEYILCRVSYTSQDGTFVDRFCPLAKVEKPEYTKMKERWAREDAEARQESEESETASAK